MFSRDTAIGKKSAVRPRIANTLNILEPTTLPIATSEFPPIAPTVLTTNSGNDVPMPTITAPITKLDTLHFLATTTAPFTRKSAPSTIPASDRIKIRYSMLTHILKPSKNNLPHLSHSFWSIFIFSSVVYIQYTPSSKRNLYSKIIDKSEAVYFFHVSFCKSAKKLLRNYYGTVMFLNSSCRRVLA